MIKKYNVIDLFCGCGGLSEGFRLAGCQIIGGIDFNEAAIKTFNRNFPNAKGICMDMLEIDKKIIEKDYKDFLKTDIIIGGPPCQGFSSANRYQKEDEDKRNRLFFEFVKFVDVISPSVIVIENVRGIITKDNGYAKNRIYEIFEKLGYYVNHKILDASEYGVPQKRLRNFFVILKKEKFNFDKLKKIRYPNVKEAISELYNFENSYNENGVYKILFEAKTKYQKYLRNSKNMIYNHLIKYPSEIVQKRISHVNQGGNWKEIPDYLFENKRTNRHSSAYKRLNEKSYSVTIDTGNSHSNYFHPIYNRIPTVREAARLQSFNDNFIFEGSRTEQYKQVGNAVPPLLSKSLAEGIMEVLNNEK